MRRKFLLAVAMVLGVLGITVIESGVAGADYSAPCPGGSNGWFDATDVGGTHHQAMNCSVDYYNSGARHYCMDAHAGANVSYCVLEMWARPSDTVTIGPNGNVGGNYGIGYVLTNNTWNSTYGFYQIPGVSGLSSWSHWYGSYYRKTYESSVPDGTRSLGRQAQPTNEALVDIEGNTTFRRFGWNNGQPQGRSSISVYGSNGCCQVSAWIGYVPNN